MSTDPQKLHKPTHTHTHTHIHTHTHTHTYTRTYADILVSAQSDISFFFSDTKLPNLVCTICLTKSSKMCFLRVSRMQTRNKPCQCLSYETRSSLSAKRFNNKEKSSNGQQPSEYNGQGLQRLRQKKHDAAKNGECHVLLMETVQH